MWSLTDRALKPSPAAVFVYVDQMVVGVRMFAEVHQGEMSTEVHEFSSPQQLRLDDACRGATVEHPA